MFIIPYTIYINYYYAVFLCSAPACGFCAAGVSGQSEVQSHYTGFGYMVPLFKALYTTAFFYFPWLTFCFPDCIIIFFHSLRFACHVWKYAQSTVCPIRSDEPFMYYCTCNILLQTSTPLLPSCTRAHTV